MSTESEIRELETDLERVSGRDSKLRRTKTGAIKRRKEKLKTEVEKEKEHCRMWHGRR